VEGGSEIVGRRQVEGGSEIVGRRQVEGGSEKEVDRVK
jgi:hypothetical protein